MLLYLLLILSVSRAEQIISAESLYRNYQDRIFQVQVIDLASSKKSSIGSGFLVSNQGLIATNYHVIAETIHSADNYRIEYLDSSGNTGELNLVAIDVIHDLAIVRADLSMPDFLQMSTDLPAKGEHIYAIGNPHDLGMSIVEGTFNGLLEKSQYQKILFSGSLNPGMSGGPALDKTGMVIGVNVSTAGNDLSFLVPAKYLHQLVDTAITINEVDDFNGIIEQQLVNNQQSYMRQLIDASWNMIDLGDVQVPGEIRDYFKCWGKTDTDEEKLFEHTYTACASPDMIYISPQFNTGNIDFRYDWFKAGKLNKFQFYTLFASKFSGSYSTNQASREDVSNYRCQTGFVEINNIAWRTALCFRKYKKFSRLYDMSLTMAQVDYDDRGLLINMNATGLTRDNAMQFVKKYMESIQ